MSNNVIAIIVFLVSMLVTASIMELVKATKTKKPIFWWVFSGVLSIICTCSVWFGIDHTGNIWLLPLVLITGYLGQYIIDMKIGVKKVFTWIFNSWATKHGYTKIQEDKCVE